MPSPPSSDDDTLGSLASLLEAAARTPAVTISIQPGTLIGGRFRVEQRIGIGGMGVVYRARDTKLERDVAIKLHAYRKGEKGAARLLREAVAMAQLSHPNVVTAYEVEELDEGVFIAMELVDGRTVRAWLAEKPRGWREIVRVFLGAGAGLAAVHGAGLVHRDFKPDNVLVGADGRVRVADLGLALAAGAREEGPSGGTPAYMAPEQRSGEEVDARADQYGFCVALHEALFGARPGSGAASGRGVPRRVQRILRRGLAERPEARYPTMEALLADLGRDPKWRRRTLAAAAAVALAAAAALLVSFDRRAARNAAEARARVLDSLEEQGRQQFLAGDPLRAVAFLHAALDEGRDGVALRYVLARALEPFAAERALLPHARSVFAHDLSPDGARIVSAGWDGRLALWDAASGARLAAADGDPATRTARFSPDGAWIATVTEDGKAKIWDGPTLALRHKLDEATSVAFAPDGKRFLVTATDRTARLVRLADGAVERTFTLARRPADGAFDAGGKRILLRAGAEATLWDIDRPDPLARFEKDGLWLLTAFLSDDGATVVTVGGSAVWSWDAATGSLLATMAHPQEILAAALSDDGTRLVTAGADAVSRLWETRTGKLVHVLVGPPGDTAMRFCAGDRVVVAGTGAGPVRVWDPDSGRIVDTHPGHHDRITNVTCDATAGRVVSSSFDHTVRVWDRAVSPIGVAFAAGSRGVKMVDVSRDGRWLATVGIDNQVSVWDLERRERVARIEGQTAMWAMFSPDARALVIANGGRNNALVWERERAEVTRTLAGHAGVVGYATFSPDGERIATASLDGTAMLWDAAGGAPIATLRGHDEGVYSASFSPDGSRLVTAGRDDRAKVWDVASATLVFPLVGHTGAVYVALYDRAGSRIVTASHDRSARVWDARTGAPLLLLQGHPREVHGALFSPDGELIVTTGFDGVVNVWDAAGGRLLQTLADHRGRVAPVVFRGPDALVSGGFVDDIVQIRDIHRETRSAAELLRLVTCRIPFRVERGTLMPRPIDWETCARR